MTSIGLSLTDTLDDLINEGRIEPQLAMKILSNFDRVVTEVLADKVRSKLHFKVRRMNLRLAKYTFHVVLSASSRRLSCKTKTNIFDLWRADM